MQFRIQRLIFTTGEGAKISPVDFEHYSELKGKPYPVEARFRL
jgi:hypothetical protein